MASQEVFLKGDASFFILAKKEFVVNFKGKKKGV